MAASTNTTRSALLRHEADIYDTARRLRSATLLAKLGETESARTLLHDTIDAAAPVLDDKKLPQPIRDRWLTLLNNLSAIREDYEAHPVAKIVREFLRSSVDLERAAEAFGIELDPALTA
ncbi:MAG: hypothetical protein JOZ16_18590 [Methylobacteriaceae bacterium]|nr:hypothetical protein [Methylobacteriaceae bacterium]